MSSQRSQVSVVSLEVGGEGRGPVGGKARYLFRKSL